MATIMSAGSLPRPDSQEQALIWTDDLPVCMLSAVGVSTNQVYRDDGSKREEHPFEDRSFHFKVDDICLYGVFDGHDGSKASHFTAQRMPAELLLGQLKGNISDDQVKQALHQAFVSVEKGYFESIDDALAEKCKLMLHVPEGVPFYEASQQCPQLFKQLEDVETEIKGGTMGAMAVIKENRLYIANIGYCRALLCKIDDEGTLRVMQLTKDHDLYNEEELQRLLESGLDVEKIRQEGKLGDHQHSRSIGDYNVKSGYKEIEILSASQSEPVIATPEVTIEEIDDACKFLIIMSNGLFKSLELATSTEHVNRDIASMVASEFSMQTTLAGVVQAVVDKVVRIHHDTYLINVGQRKDMCQKRDDITLLVRNFNYPFPNAANSPTITTTSSPFNMPSNHQQTLAPLSVIIPPGGSNSPGRSPPQLQLITTNASHFHHNTNSRTIMSGISTLSSSTHRSYTNTSSNNSTQSSDDPQFLNNRNINQKPVLPLDDNGRVTAYVDFSMFCAAMDELSVDERNELEAELEPRPAYETIPEEKELECDGSFEDDEVDGLVFDTDFSQTALFT